MLPHHPAKPGAQIQIHHQHLLVEAMSADNNMPLRHDERTVAPGSATESSSPTKGHSLQLFMHAASNAPPSFVAGYAYGLSQVTHTYLPAPSSFPLCAAHRRLAAGEAFFVKLIFCVCRHINKHCFTCRASIRASEHSNRAHAGWQSKSGSVILLPLSAPCSTASWGI